MKNKNIATLYAVIAATLYALNAPLSKLLLSYIKPTMMAAFLYLGAGLGLFLYGLFEKATNKNIKHDHLTKKELPYTIAMVLLDIVAPILLMFGIKMTTSANVSLLNNFEIVCTSLIALFIFKEVVSKKMWIAISLITLSSFLLSFEDITTFKLSWGAILVILATLCWGLENNCTRNLSSKNTYHVVFLKGIFSGLGSLIVALCLKESFPNIGYFALALLLGFVAYGLSIFFYIKAQGVIGASKTSAFYSVAPFIGTFLSFIIFKEKLTWSYFVGLAIMIIGTIIVVIDTLAKKHSHVHKHVITHMHDASTHSHVVEHEHEHNHYLNDEKHIHHHSKFVVE